MSQEALKVGMVDEVVVLEDVEATALARCAAAFKVHVRVLLYFYILTDVYIYKCIHVCINMYIYVCVNFICIYVYIYIYIYVYIYIYTYTYVYIYIYIYIRTQMYICEYRSKHCNNTATTL